MPLRTFTSKKASKQSRIIWLTFVKQLVENQDHQLNTDEAAKRALIKKKLMTTRLRFSLGLSYLNRYYGVKFDDVNLKQLMLFKPDFYGKNVDVLDRLIEIGSKEDYIKGNSYPRCLPRSRG